MIRGQEFHAIIDTVFDGDVKRLNESEQLQVNCPRCQEREGLYKPDGKYNLEINTAKQVFKCWKCDFPQFKGSLGKLIRIFGRKIDYDLYNSYAGRFKPYTEEVAETEDFGYVELPQEYIPFKNMDINNPQHLEAYNYLIINRKLTYEKIIDYELGFCLYGRYANRIIIPSYDKYGDLNYFVSRKFNNKVNIPYLNPDVDKKLIIFNEKRINWDSTVYLVEGPFDYLALHDNTIPLLGKVMSNLLFNTIAQKKPNIVVVLDPDAKAKTIEMIQLLSSIYMKEKHKIKIVMLKGKYDIDEIHRYFGNKPLKQKLRTARILNTDDYFTMKKFRTYGKSYQKGITTTSGSTYR